MESVFFRNDKFVFTFTSEFACDEIDFYEVSFIEKYEALQYLLEKPIEKIKQARFEKNILYTIDTIPLTAHVEKVYRLRCITSNAKFELHIVPNSVRLTKLFALKNTTATVELYNIYEEDELSYKYTLTNVNKQMDKPLIVLDYMADFPKDYRLDIGVRLENLNKQLVFRYKDMNLTLYDDIMFGNIGNELSIIDMSGIKEDLHNDICKHTFSENTIFNKGIWVFKEEHKNILSYMELQSVSSLHINHYFVKEFPKNIQDFIKTLSEIPTKDIELFMTKSMLLIPNLDKFLREHNGIWFK